MKKVLLGVICGMVLLCLVFMGCGSDSNEVVVNGIKYTKVTYIRNGESTEGYSVSGCNAGLEVLNIAETVKGLPVLGFDKLAFKGNNDIKEVTIPDSIKSISLSTAPFSGCNNIEKITMPFSDLILLFNFYGGGSSGNTMPASLKTVYISNACTTIDTKDFYNCSNLKEVHIPSSVTRIKDGTGYTNVGANGHPADSNKFGDLPFYGCTNLTIYCEATSKPSGWDTYWNYIDSTTQATVLWGNY